MRLYSAALSVFGAKAQIAVAEKNIPCEIELVPYLLSTGYNPKHPEVVRINPKSQVPVLIDGDLEIYDSTQIFEYLEDCYPEAPLWPTDPSSRARARQLEHSSDEVFFPHVLILIQRKAGHSEEKKAAARQGIENYYDQMEELLTESSFLAGDYSYADIGFLMAHHHGVLLGCDFHPHHKNLEAWRRRMLARPAVKGVIEPMRLFIESQGLTAPGFTK